uniref:uncharacterized protein n=1 Tax=Semicossyphus pulcher TaxID=241346 RepID=UPI0037E92804
MNEQILDYIFSLFKTIYRMAENVKANKERCKELAQKVRSLEKQVCTIQQRGPGQISITVEETLMYLCRNLEAAKDWMMKYSQSKRMMSFLKSSSHEQKFYKLDKKLTENFNLLSGALLIEQGDMLKKVWDSVRIREVDQSRPKIPFPIINSPDPTPTPQTKRPPSPIITPMPPPGPIGFSLDLNPGLLSKNPVFNQVMPPNLSGTLPGIGFSNNILYRPPTVPQIVNVSTMAPVSVFRPFSLMTYPKNTPAITTVVVNRSFVWTNMGNTF